MARPPFDRISDALAARSFAAFHVAACSLTSGHAPPRLFPDLAAARRAAGREAGAEAVRVVELEDVLRRYPHVHLLHVDIQVT
jgi:hypothetical protein